jgi:hypothetical protein
VLHSINVLSALHAADHPPRGIFHPLGAAFFSNASYQETVKVVDTSGVSIEEFKLAGARQQFRFNETTGATEAVPALSGLPLQAVAAEIPRYIQLWNQQFAPYSVTSFKV